MAYGPVKPDGYQYPDDGHCYDHRLCRDVNPCACRCERCVRQPMYREPPWRMRRLYLSS